MAAGINDKFKKVSADNSYAVATTVKTARTVGGGTTLEAFDLSKWADATAVNFLTYRKTTDPVTNITTVTNRTGWTALVNTGSNTLTNLTVAPGYTDLGHQVGDYIEPVQMSKWANDLVDGILVTHNQDGTLKNKVATLGKIHGGSTDGVLLTDASGNVTGGKVAASKLDFTTLRLANVTSTVNQTVTSLTDITGLSATVSVSSGQTIHISASVNFTISANAWGYVGIYDGSTLIRRSGTYSNGAAVTGFVEATITPSAGSHTYTIKLAPNTGTATTRHASAGEYGEMTITA